MNHFIKRWSFAWIGVALAIFMNAAMAWITFTGLQLNRERQKTEAEFTYNNQMRLALWRLDSALAPIVATEAAKPIEVVTALAQAELPKQTTNYVVGYFEGYLEQATPDQSKSNSNPASPLQQSLVIEYSTLPLAVLNKLQAGNRLQTNLLALAQSRTSAISNGSSDHNNVAQATQLPDPSVSLNALQSFNSTLTDQRTTSSLPASPAEIDKQFETLAGKGQQAAIVQDRVQRGNLYLGNLRVQNEAQQQIANNYQSFQPQAIVDSAVPLFQPTWVDDQLFLMRRSGNDVSNRAAFRFQGVLLDWPAIKSDAIFAVSDLLNEPDIEAWHDESNDSEPRINGEYLLASLPAVLHAKMPQPRFAWSAIHYAILGGWLAVWFTILISGLVMFSLWKLSEQRASFVSAVTHELQTPLTTFRMYSELLAHGMVPEEKRGTYLNVLCQQADRLTHLIDNVLTFARLERKAIHNARIELTVAELIESMRQSLEQRLSNSDFDIQWEVAKTIDSQFLQTDPAAVEQILANLIDNSVKYASNASEKTIQIRVTPQGKHLFIHVIDQGPGITSHDKRKLFRPFSRSAEQAAGSAPGVGLGLALCSRIAKSLGGELSCPASRIGCEMQLRLPLLPGRS